MDKAIWKHVLEMQDEQEIEFTAGAKLLSVEEQFGLIVLYALENV